MKKKIIIAVVVILLLVGGYFLFGHKSKTAPQPTVAVTKGNITEKAQAVGYIKPRHSITVKSQVDGIVAEIFHDEGEYVKKGEPLLTVKPAPAPANYATTYEGLQEALATERSAYKDLQRYKEALKKGLITRSYTDYIGTEKTYETAKAQRILAAQKLALLDKGKTQVGKQIIANVIDSPINGYILDKIVDVGDPVLSLSSAQASTALFTIANMNDLMFEGDVDEMDANKIHLTMPVTVTVGAIPNQKITGKLTQISLQSEQESVSGAADANSPFNVGFKIEVTNLQIPTNVDLRAGYSATADINIKTVQNVLILPERVIQFDGVKPYVLLPSADKTTPKKQYIKIGLSDGMNAEITQGVTEGQKVLDVQPDSDA